MLAREDIRPVKLLLKQKEGAEGEDLFISLPASCKMSLRLPFNMIFFEEFL